MRIYIKLALFIIAIATLSVFIQSSGIQDSIKIYIGTYEVRILGLLLLILLTAVLFYFLIWLFRIIFRIPNSISQWSGERNSNQAHEQLGAGYLSLIKGEWNRAIKQLTAKPEHSKLPFINYLAAAQANQHLGKIEHRDNCLKQALDNAPEERLAVGLIKSKLQLEADQYELALSTLSDIEDIGSKNSRYIELLLQAYIEIKDWQKVIALLPTAKKYQAVPDDQLFEIESNAYFNEFCITGNKKELWNNLPKAQKQQLPMIIAYCKSQIETGNSVETIKLIQSTIKSTWSDELICLYGSIKTDKPEKALKYTQKLMANKNKNAVLNLVAGKFAVQAKKLNLAKQYLQSAIHNGDLPEAYARLGEIFEEENQPMKALALYRSGLNKTHTNTV